MTYNHSPHFAGGHSQTFSVCDNATMASINALMGVTDSDMQQTLTWSVLTPPAHGTLGGSYSGTTTGGLITPTGLSYTATVGYSGPDTFRMVVSDCDARDTTAIYVTVHNCSLGVPYALAATSTLSVYPNPGSGTFVCTLTSVINEPVRISITNAVGETIKELTTQTNSPTEILLDAPAGVYLITAYTAAGRLTARVAVVR